MSGDQHQGGWGFHSVVIQFANKKFQMLFTRQCLVFWWWGFRQSCMTLATPWTVACQVPLSVRFSRQEYWRGLPFPPPGDLPNPGIEPWSPALQVDSLPTEPPGKPFWCSRLLYMLLSVYFGLKITCVLAI